MGYLGISPSNTPRLGAFEIGFLTFPAAITEMPGANFWAVLFFLTLLLLGISSTYPMLDVIVTCIQDRWSVKVRRIYVTTTLVLVAFLLSIIYSTRAGYYVLDGVDRWINNMSVVFVVWSEVALSTSIYRHRDLFDEVGKPAYLLYNFGYFAGQILGVAIGHVVNPGAGAGVGFGVYIVSATIAVLVAKSPNAEAPRFWGKSTVLRKFWFLAFYSVSPLPSPHSLCGIELTSHQGNQLRRDLNAIVGQGKNWRIRKPSNPSYPSTSQTKPKQTNTDAVD